MQLTYKPYIGQKIDKLTVISKPEYINNRRVVSCQCECNSEPKYYDIRYLFTRKKACCGCQHGSLNNNGIKRCGVCLTTKPIVDFCKDAHSVDGFHYKCKKCHFYRHYLYKYKITRQEYDDMFCKQNFTCYICKRNPSDKETFELDHNHKSNQYRKILCCNCNSALGLFNEDVNIIKSAIEYLITHEKM